MKNITGYLREKYGRWGWMGQRAHDAVGINDILPLDFIISCDYGKEVPYYFSEDDVFSGEKKIGIRKNWSNEDLKSSLDGSMGREIYSRWDSYSEPVNLLCYRSLKRLEARSKKYSGNPRIYSASEKLKRHFDNKILLHRNMKRLELPEIRGIIEKPGKITFRSVQKELSSPFVVQFPYGSSGSSTFIIENEKEYNDLRRKCPDQQAVIREYIAGFSLNVNAIIVSTPDGAETYSSMPSVQITGLPECSNFPAAYCGNDYALVNDMDPATIEQVGILVKRIGKWMGEAGFRGVFGMDFMVRNDIVYVMEINPRFQNSTGLYAVLRDMDTAGMDALFLLHIAEFLQKEDAKMRKFVEKFDKESLMSPVSGSQVILHNREISTIVAGELEAGVYRLSGEKLEFIRKGASLKDCKEKGDVLITCGVPKIHTPVEPNAPICKVQSRRNLLDPGNRRYLTTEGKLIVKGVYKKLYLKDADRMEMAAA
ncbi:ATP-grasp domain-containing protein [Candidatus Omnitrophota bacterium]